jgi:hypothetical protein
MGVTPNSPLRGNGRPECARAHWFSFFLYMECFMHTIAIGLESAVDRAARELQAKTFFKVYDQERIALRTLPDAGSSFHDWSDLDDVAELVVSASRPPEESEFDQNVYFVINDVREEDFLDMANGTGAARAVGAKHIARRTHFYVDIDPARQTDGDKKVAATDAEREWAEAACERVVMIAALHGFPTPLIVDTGNGYQLHWRIDMPNDPAADAIIKRILKAFAALIDSDLGKVDTSVSNPDRLGRVPGTYNRKGPHTADRPHRLAQIVLLPEADVLNVVDVAILEAFCTAVSGTITVQDIANVAGVPLGEQTFHALVEEVKFYLQEHDAPPVSDVIVEPSRVFLKFAHCPYRGPDHTDGDAAVIIHGDGGIGAKCFHAKCEGNNWQRLQELLGATFFSRTMLGYAERTRKTLPRKFSDPFILAQRHFDHTRLPDGAPSLAFVHGEMFQYYPGGWRLTPVRELRAPVRDTIQSAFDENWIVKPGQRLTPPSVMGSHVTNTITALESLAHCPMDPTVTPPFWLSPQYDSHPLDLLVMRNGILDLRKWLDGADHFYPLTAHLFVEAVGDYDFDASHLHAPNWIRFLESLGQDDQWYACLQQMMGSFLWPAYDLQKLYMFVGPPRCGKGTIARVLEGLLGVQNVCSPNLADFAKPFGLEQALGKRLAIVPEVGFPSRDAT